VAPDQREYAGLDREVVVSGAFSRIEIWDAQRWAERKVGGQSILAAATSVPGLGI
jgi:DNA-binding transcriptional regulator/RsmH inhibitor MraZ